MSTTLGPAEELVGALVYTAAGAAVVDTAATAAVGGVRASYGVYVESPEQRQRILQQLQQEQQQEQQQELTPDKVIATVRRVSGVKGNSPIHPVEAGGPHGQLYGGLQGRRYGLARLWTNNADRADASNAMFWVLLFVFGEFFSR